LTGTERTGYFATAIFREKVISQIFPAHLI
jgi:hypothetical protein